MHAHSAEQVEAYEDDQDYSEDPDTSAGTPSLVSVVTPAAAEQQ